MLGRAEECDWKLGGQDSKASRRSGQDFRPVGLLTPRPARGSVRPVAFSVGHVWPALQHRQVSHVVAGLQQFFPQTGTERVSGKTSVKDAVPAKKIIAERGWGGGARTNEELRACGRCDEMLRDEDVWKTQN